MYTLNAIDTDNNDASLGEFNGETFAGRDDAQSAANYLNDLHGCELVEVVAISNGLTAQ